MRGLIAGLAMCGIVTAANAQVVIQRVGPGSTNAGDVLRGQGVYLQGAAWYELNSAKARELDAKTMMAVDRWNREIYDAYRQEQAYRTATRKRLTQKQEEEARRRYEEREARLRKSPLAEEIQSGDALNALLADLSDPSISSSVWREAKVKLPEGITIPSLAFKFVAKPGARGSQMLSKGVIALGLLDTRGQWPDYFPASLIHGACEAYEAVYQDIRSQSLAGRLEAATIAKLDTAIQELRTQASTKISSNRGYRAAGVKLVNQMKQASFMFDADTIGFAREIISDTQEHKASTVGELVAFMQKYRLKFGSADDSPAAGEVYGHLYALLREQKEAFGNPGAPMAHARERRLDKEGFAEASEALVKSLEKVAEDSKAETPELSKNPFYHRTRAIISVIQRARSEFQRGSLTAEQAAERVEKDVNAKLNEFRIIPNHEVLVTRPFQLFRIAVGRAD